MSADRPQSPFLTLKEAAALLRYSTSSLYKRTDIPRTKLPGSKDWRYERETLLVWAKSAAPRQLEPKSEPTNPATANQGNSARFLVAAIRGIANRSSLCTHASASTPLPKQP